MPTALEVFTMLTPVKITGRTSTITNSFVNAIIPAVWPTEAEVSEALEVLGMSPDTISCAYCGDTKTEWDHLRPLVRTAGDASFRALQAGAVGTLDIGFGESERNRGGTSPSRAIHVARFSTDH